MEHDSLIMWSTFIGVLVVSIVFGLRVYSKYLRKKRFLIRPVINSEQWYETYYPSHNVDKDIAKDVLNVISKDIWVDPTQILPTDRFREDLFCQDWWGLKGEGLDRYDDWLTEYTQYTKKLPESTLKEVYSSNTVDELLLKLTQLKNR